MKILRSWLVYSESQDRIYCVVCKLFSKRSNAFISGFNQWTRLTAECRDHERTLFHFNAMHRFEECMRALETGSGIDAEAQKRFDELVEYWRSVLRRLFLIAQCMAEENMAFRGSGGHEKIGDPSCGKFLKLVQMIEKFDWS